MLVARSLKLYKKRFFLNAKPLRVFQPYEETEKNYNTYLLVMLRIIPQDTDKNQRRQT